MVEEAETTHCLFAASPLKEIVFRMEEFGFPSLKYSGTEYIKDGGNYCFVEKEWKEAGKKYLELIKNNPELLDKVNREAIAWGEKLLVFGKELLNREYDNLSNDELAELYNHFEFLREEAHIRRGVVWIVETGDEFFSSYLISYLKDEINKQCLDLNADSVFAILSTPLKTNNVFQEKTDFLSIAIELKKNKIQDHEKIKARLARHIEKYCWLPYGVTGPAWDAGYFVNAMKEILARSEDKINEELEKEEKSLELTQKKQQEIYKQLRIDDLHRKLIQLAQDSIYMKACTKEAMFFGYYAAEKLFKEIAGRLGIDMRLLRKVLPWEIGGLLKTGKADIGELEKRYEYSFYLTEKGESKILTGDDAREFVKAIKLKRGKIVDESVIEIKGNCAQAGSATGTVKIINAVADLSKMKKGDILVSRMTDPQIISALKMASAIVTDMGGITCHAAIVSRELGIPCVIGTKIATKVLKDGDRVGVDANNGIIKKL